MCSDLLCEFTKECCLVAAARYGAKTCQVVMEISVHLERRAYLLKR